MKITIVKKKIQFVPENDVDCFNLGKFSTSIINEMEIREGPDDREIVAFRIRIDSLWNWIVTKRFDNSDKYKGV